MNKQNEHMWKQITCIILFVLMGYILLEPTPEVQTPTGAGIKITEEVRTSTRTKKFAEAMKLATKEGAIVVQCSNKKCYNTADGVEVGTGQDGYYAVFMDESANDATKTKKLAAAIKELNRN